MAINTESIMAGAHWNGPSQYADNYYITCISNTSVLNSTGAWEPSSHVMNYVLYTENSFSEANLNNRHMDVAAVNWFVYLLTAQVQQQSA